MEMEIYKLHLIENQSVLANSVLYSTYMYC
jgi:hypothetical protein